MSLLDWGDFDDDEDAVWTERTVRILVPRKALGLTVQDMLRPSTPADETPWTLDTTRSALIGEPAQCPCGKVAVRYGAPGDTPHYVWGYDRYGKGDEKHRVPGQYCPSCDGGEDAP